MKKGTGQNIVGRLNKRNRVSSERTDGFNKGARDFRGITGRVSRKLSQRLDVEKNFRRRRKKSGNDGFGKEADRVKGKLNSIAPFFGENAFNKRSRKVQGLGQHLGKGSNKSGELNRPKGLLSA